MAYLSLIVGINRHTYVQCVLTTLVCLSPMTAYLPRKLKSFDPVPEKYLRIMIIADETVTNHYGKETAKRYLHAVMSAVSTCFF